MSSLPAQWSDTSGPSVVSSDIYANGNYDNHVLSPTHDVSNSYLTYHSTDGSSHESNYCEQQSHYNTNTSSTHYNSSNNSGQTYGQSVNHFNDMYTTCSSYAALSPAIRQPIHSSNLKYWSSDQMSHNSHNNYSQGIPPPPLVTRSGLGLRSPTERNNYSATSVQHRSASQSPQDWSRSPNVMHSPSTTPSPLPHTSHSIHNNRSPSHMSSPQFSPSHSSPTVGNDSSVLKSDNTFSNQNHRTSQSNPLQSLQKMVMIDSTEGTDTRNSYDMTATTLQNNGSVAKNMNSDHNVNADPDSPYPTYYNLDQNRLCTPTPPRPTLHTNPNQSYDTIPNTTSSDGQLCANDKELNKCDKNDIKCNNNSTVDNNGNNDLIFMGADHSKETVPEMVNKSNVALNSGVSVNGQRDLKKEISLVKSDCVVRDEKPALCQRSSSQESIQSSDSEQTHAAYADPRAHHNWQMGGHYYSSPADKNAWPQWPHNSGQHSVPHNSDYIPDGRHGIPNSAPLSDYTSHQSVGAKQRGSGSWSASASSSQNSSQQQQRDFASPNNAIQNLAASKKRGRPFGSKNRRNSDDTNSETNASDVSNTTKKKRKTISTEEIGINTNVTLDAHGFDELSVVNPSKHSSKRKKTVGPVIRLEKGKGSVATVYSIVNTLAKPEDEKDLKSKSQSSKLEPIKPTRRPSLLVSSKKIVSTLSPQYDYNTRDKTWVCALCHKGPHYKCLGDLYGPYYISSKTSASVASTSQTPSLTTRSASIDDAIDSVVAEEVMPQSGRRGKRRKSETTEEAKETPVTSNKSRPPKSAFKTVGSSDSSAGQTEVWVHEDCIVWSSGVYLIGHRVRHLEEAISESSESFCTKCKLSGATLGCLQKSCNTSQFHYLCAKEKGCQLDDENFSLLCPKHKKKGKSSADDTSSAALS